MSVSSSVARTTVLVTALPATIPIFEFDTFSDLLVVDGGASNTGRDPATVLTHGSDYTTTGGGYNASNQLQSGAIIVVAGGAGDVQFGDYITITRNISLTQPNSFIATGPKTPLITEQDDDNLTEIAQELNDGVVRSMRAPVQEDLDWVMPNALARASSFPFFDANGDLIVYTLADLVAAVGTGSSSAVHANYAYMGPTSGSAAIPTFRAITSADLTGLTGFASAGLIGASGLTMHTGKLLGRTTGLTGAIEDITASANLSLAAGTLDTVQDIQTTSEPQFKRVYVARSDNDYSFISTGAVKSFGTAVSGTTFVFDSLTNGTIYAVDDSANWYFSKLTTNGLLRTQGGSGLTTVAAFGQIPGTATNDSAAAGDVGEYKETVVAAGSAISLSTGTAADVTSVSLTAGDWDVEGIVKFLYAATTTSSALVSWINLTSATYPGSGTGSGFFSVPVTANTGNLLGLPTPTLRVSIATTTTVYLGTAATFATSTMTAFGSIRARRVR